MIAGWIAGTVGACSHVLYLPLRDEEQRRRVTPRYATTPDQTFHTSDVDLEQWRGQSQAPDDDELRGSQLPPVPPEHATWSKWASQRWPSLPDQYASVSANRARPSLTRGLDREDVLTVEDNSLWPAAESGDGVADVYDVWFDPGRRAPDAAVEFLSGLAGDGPVLELGIGTGRIALPLSARGWP